MYKHIHVYIYIHIYIHISDLGWVGFVEYKDRSESINNLHNFLFIILYPSKSLIIHFLWIQTTKNVLKNTNNLFYFLVWLDNKFIWQFPQPSRAYHRCVGDYDVYIDMTSCPSPQWWWVGQYMLPTFNGKQDGLINIQQKIGNDESHVF